MYTKLKSFTFDKVGGTKVGGIKVGGYESNGSFYYCKEMQEFKGTCSVLVKTT